MLEKTSPIDAPMKMFIGVVSPCRDGIAQILIEDATTVEYGPPLMYIEPA